MANGEVIVRVTICGRVQGVGYRAWTQIEATSRGITGWVRNRSNGDVEALFAGPADAVEALCAACWRGPAHARVDQVEVKDASPEALTEIAVRPGFRLIATL